MSTISMAEFESRYRKQPVQGIFRYTSKIDAECLVALARHFKPALFVEFGINNGALANIIMRYCKFIERYVGVDVTSEYVPALALQAKEIPAAPGSHVKDDRLSLIIRRGGTLDLQESDLGQPDFIFIDGDHSAAVVRHDTELARRVIKPGGVIAWHDYHNPHVSDVTRVLDAYNKADDRIVHIEGTMVCFELCH